MAPSTSSSSEIIVTSFRLPFSTARRDNGSIGRSESRDEWARSLAHVVTQSRGQWVGWAGIALQQGQPVPGPDQGDSSPTANLTSAQVLPCSKGSPSLGLTRAKARPQPTSPLLRYCSAARAAHPRA